MWVRVFAQLPQKLNKTASELLRSKKTSKNIDLSLRGKQYDFPKLHFFLPILAHCAPLQSEGERPKDSKD